MLLISFLVSFLAIFSVNAFQADFVLNKTKLDKLIDPNTSKLTCVVKRSAVYPNGSTAKELCAECLNKEFVEAVTGCQNDAATRQSCYLTPTEEKVVNHATGIVRLEKVIAAVDPKTQDYNCAISAGNALADFSRISVINSGACQVLNDKKIDPNNKDLDRYIQNNCKDAKIFFLNGKVASATLTLPLEFVCKAKDGKNYLQSKNPISGSVYAEFAAYDMFATGFCPNGDCCPANNVVYKLRLSESIAVTYDPVLDGYKFAGDASDKPGYFYYLYFDKVVNNAVSDSYLFAEAPLFEPIYRVANNNIETAKQIYITVKKPGNSSFTPKSVPEDLASK
jgi:hypothetical protein